MADLLEVRTGDDSPLMQAGRDKDVVVEEFGLHNGYDMMCTSSKHKSIRRARTTIKRPRAVLLSRFADNCQ